MTDQIPADKVRKIASEMRAAMRRDDSTYHEGEFLSDMSDYIRDLDKLCARARPRPTLADMDDDGRAACKWMQCGTPTGSDHLAVGTVIESADDPRIDALPVGSILIDSDEEATIKGRGEWTGAGYIPIPSEGAEYGPWTVLHIPKEEA